MASRLKWFDDEKGYGFIEYKDNKDVFVCYSAIREDVHKSLSQEEYIEFELIKSNDGYKAKNLESTKEEV